MRFYKEPERSYQGNMERDENTPIKGTWNVMKIPFVFTDWNGNGLDDGRETQANIYQALTL